MENKFNINIWKKTIYFIAKFSLKMMSLFKNKEKQNNKQKEKQLMLQLSILGFYELILQN